VKQPRIIYQENDIRVKDRLDKEKELN